MSCSNTLMIEIFIFDTKSDPPEDTCCICLENLTDVPTMGCSCSFYPRKFRSCGHWVHVSCFFHSKIRISNCPICHSNLSDNEFTKNFLNKK